MKGIATGRGTPWLGLVLLAAAAFAVSCRLSVRAAHTAALQAPPSGLARLFGESRLALSGRLYEEADLYFHKGAEHIPTRAFTDGFTRLATRVSPEMHVHAAGQEVVQMMPWLELALKMDPHNVEVWEVAAFWLSREAGRSDLALHLLQEAQAANPFDYSVQLEKGRLLLRQRDWPAATRAIDAGLAFWDHAPDREALPARQTRATLLLYRELLHEIAGEREPAVANLEAILAMFPARTHLQDRIAALRQNQAPSTLAPQALRDTLREDLQKRPACPRGDDDHAHDHE